MTPNRLSDYLDHLQQAASDAISFVDGLDKAAFLEDKRTQRAVVMSLMIIGEAATQLMEHHPEFIDRTDHVPWKSMRGMRNRIAHGYFDLNLDIVWETVQTALPALLLKITKLQAHPAGDGSTST